MNFGGGYGPSRGYGGPDINRLTTAPVLPDGWSKVGKGLWRHENGEESRVNPSALFTNSNFVESTRTHDDRIKERARASEYSHRQSSVHSVYDEHPPRSSYRQASTEHMPPISSSRYKGCVEMRTQQCVTTDYSFTSATRD